MDNAEAEALFEHAAALYKSRKYETALGVLKQLDSKYPDNVDVLFPLARCLAKLERDEEALGLCDALIENHAYRPAEELRDRIRSGTAAARSVPVQGTGLDVLGLDLDGDPNGALFKHTAPPQSRSTTGLVIGALLAIALCAAAAGTYVLLAGQARSESEPQVAVASPEGVGQALSSAVSMPEIDASGAPELVRTRSSHSSDGVTVNASVEYGVWTNCGGYDAFLTKFAACEPAAIRMQAMGSFIIEYRVLGQRDGVCQIEMRWIQMPMFEDWVGKAMTCPCDSTTDFVTLTEQIDPGRIMDGSLRCNGPLYDAMIATLSQYQ